MTSMRVLILLVAAQTLLPAGAQSQQENQSARFPVAIVEVEHLDPGSGPFEVVRRPHSSPSDVILIRENTTPRVLSQAIWTLLIAHQLEPGIPSKQHNIKMADFASQSGELRRFPWADRVLEDMATAQVVKIEGLGYRKAVVIFLPRERAMGSVDG